MVFIMKKLPYGAPRKNPWITVNIDPEVHRRLARSARHVDEGIKEFVENSISNRCAVVEEKMRKELTTQPAPRSAPRSRVIG